MCICECVSGCVFYLNRSGTEEDYTQLQQLLQDISEYNHDFEAVKEEEQKSSLKKKAAEKKRGEDMRRAAMEGMSSMLIVSNMEYLVKYILHERKTFKCQYFYVLIYIKQ